MAETNLNVVTAAGLEEFGSEMWDGMKAYVATGVEQSNNMTQVKNKLNSANRQNVGTTGLEKATAIDTSVTAMVAAFENAGVSMTGITTAQFAQCIASLAANTGIYIMDSDGLQWTAENWAYQKQQQGHDPATPEGILVVNPDHDFLVASKNYGRCMFGTYSHTLPNLEAFEGGVAGTPKDGTYNSRKIMAATNPENCEAGRKITYFAGMDDTDLVNKDVVFFPDESTLTTWAASMGLGTMQTIGDKIIYAIPHASVANAWVLKYCKLGTTTITFANREAQAPYADNYGQQGCTALEYCYAHKEHNADPNLWRLGSLYELLLLYLNKTGINACRAALGEADLPEAEVWSCLQSNGNNEYGFSLGTGACNTYNKSVNYWVVPIASVLRATASQS